MRAENLTSSWIVRRLAPILVALLFFAIDPTVVVAVDSADNSAVEKVLLVFTGSRRSELEPCGCQTKQVGGVDREALIYQNLRKANPNLIAMEAGVWVDPFQSPNERLKTDYLVKALHAMQFGVYNVTPIDLAFGTTYPQQLVRGGVGRLISANVVPVSGDGSPQPKPFFDPYTIVEVPRSDGGRPIRLGVIGITDPKAITAQEIQRLRGTCKEMPQYKILDVAETLKRYVPEVRGKADYVITLALMRRESASQFLGAADGVDLFVTTWGAQFTRSLTRMGKTSLIAAGYYGRFFHQTSVEFDADNRPVKTLAAQKDILSTNPKLPAVTQLIEQYKTDTRKLTRAVTVARQNSRFAGRSQCLACHKEIYLQWSRTPHNLAWVTLIRKRQQYNPDCIKCHTTGYGEKDGFVGQTQTGHLVSVQCEVCHGPSRAHVQTYIERNRLIAIGKASDLPSTETIPRLVIDTPESACIKCHEDEHDPNFDFERDLPLISHMNKQGPFRRPDKEKAPMYQQMGKSAVPTPPARLTPPPRSPGGRPPAARPRVTPLPPKSSMYK